MGMWASSEFYNSGLNWIKSNCDTICVNTTQPADGSSALEDGAMIAKSTALGSSDFTFSTGDVSGYKLAVAAQASLTVSTSGDADHISLVSSASSVLLYVTTCNTKSLTTTDTVTVPTWDIEVASPTS